MPRLAKIAFIYFLTLGCLCAASYFPLITYLAILAFGLGFVIMASNTIMVYSLAALPALVVLATRPRRVGLLMASLLPIAAVALGPGYVSQRDAASFAGDRAKDDFERLSTARPRTVEIVDDLISNVSIAGPAHTRLACSDICLRLLFNKEVESVRMVKTLPRVRGDSSAPRVAVAVTYRIEAREQCPEAFPAGHKVDPAVRNSIVAGVCLIATLDDMTPADAMLRMTTAYFPSLVEPREIIPLPSGQIISIRQLAVDAMASDGVRRLLVRRTEAVVRTIATPFYIGYHGTMSSTDGPELGYATTTHKAIDIADTLRVVFGFEVAPVGAPPAADPTDIAEKILALPRVDREFFGAELQTTIRDAVAPLRTKSSLSDADIDFLRRIIADLRVQDGSLGVHISDLFRRFPERMVVLLPTVFERLAVPAREQNGHYHSQFGWALIHYPGETLKPFRDQIMAIIESQPEWYANGLLIRVGELGGDPVDLIARRLDAASEIVRKSAAIAACRIEPSLRPAIKPVILAHLAHLAPTSSGGLSDDTIRLMLALIRFGDKAEALMLLETNFPKDKAARYQKFNALDAEFKIDQCQWW
jgi:hypothetical protein